MRILVIFEYETGNTDEQFYNIAFIVNNTSFEQLDEIESAMYDFINEGGADCLDYDEQSEELLKKLGLEYEYPSAWMPELNGYRIIHID